MKIIYNFSFFKQVQYHKIYVRVKGTTVINSPAPKVVPSYMKEMQCNMILKHIEEQYCNFYELDLDS